MPIILRKCGKEVFKMSFFEQHAHYNDEKFDEDREDVINKVYNSGVTKIVNAGYSVESSIQAIDLAEKYSFIYATCGVSPNDIPENKEEIDLQLKEVTKLAKSSKKVVAIGEIGLDYYWNKENKELQKYAFVEQIKIANEMNLPIVIHTREAVDDTLNILRNVIKTVKPGVFHCCPLNRELVKQALELGFYISLAGPVTFKNSKNANEIIEMIPNDRILIETDSPYLSPEPNRGKRNDSRNLVYIAEKIANVKNISVEEVKKITFENAKKLYNIE